MGWCISSVWIDMCDQAMKTPPDHIWPGGDTRLPGEEQSDVDSDALAVERNDTAFGRQVTGEKLAPPHGRANVMMKLALRRAREGNAARAAVRIRFAEEGNSYFGHGKLLVTSAFGDRGTGWRIARRRRQVTI
jgi:hypothetical protein